MFGTKALLMLARVVLLLLLAASASLFGSLASAQEMPGERTQAILIRSTLSTWIDALLTGNYSVMRALASDEFQAEFTEQELLEAFRPFQAAGQNIRQVQLLDPVPSPETGIDEEGRLVLAGYIDTRPSRFTYKLTFLPKPSGWELLGINVNIAAAGEGS